MAVDNGFLALDAGNAWIKGVTDSENEFLFPHALKRLNPVEVEEIELRGGSDDANTFQVNGSWFQIGEQAIRSGDGAARTGESRYEPDYYGVIAAIAAFKSFHRSTRIWFYGSHTPKDLVYRPDLIAAIQKGETWRVASCGETKSFIFKEAKGIEEPVAAYRHAVLGKDGISYKDSQLRKGEILIVDIGGFTTAFARATNGNVFYANSDTPFTPGMLDVLRELESAIRLKYKRELKGANKLPRLKLEAALRTGFYDGGMGAGDLPLTGKGFNLIESSVGWYISMLMNAISNYGGLTMIDGILLAGGGGAGLEKFIREKIRSDKVYVAEENRGRMQFATSLGMLKVYSVLKQAGKV